MFLCKYILAIVFVTFSVVISENIKTCPRFCKCDSYLQLNRAQCSSKHLISAEVDIPYEVEILDLSHNDITTVDKYCFKNFSHLKHLNLSNNALHTLDLEAFSKLLRLNELDLSNNRLEYLDERLFSKNKFLLKMNLEGNKFMSLKPKILLKNTHLKELNLRNSQINLLHSKLFAGLPNLLELDLSKNLLNNFNLKDFMQLPKLKKLNLSENCIKCDETIKNKLQILELRGINVTLDLCALENLHDSQQRPIKMFEKLISASNAMREESEFNALNGINQWRLHSNILEIDDSDEEEEEEGVEFNLKKSNFVGRNNNNEWLKFAPDSVVCGNNYVLCQEYRNCLQDLNNVVHDKRLRGGQCLLNDVQFAFFLGIALGIAVVIIILACSLCLKRCVQQKNEAINIDDIPSQPMARLTTQLPPNARRQVRSRAAAASARLVVRYEGPVGENFLSRLFGRPARHQYYRAINQNTATLISRLSRSNLFNNRLSHHFVERQSSTENPGSSNTDNDNFASSAPRAETPPPSYGDVVINNCEQEK